MLSPHTNTTYAEIAEVIRAHESFAICGHVGPDGDCLGSQIALAAALRELGKEVTCLLAKPDPIDHSLLFLPGLDEFVVGEDFADTPEVFIAVDVPRSDRLETGEAVHARTPITITIDHHATEAPYSQYNYIDPDSASASVLVWELAKELEATNPECAMAALTGLITDTGRFAYQNTNAIAFEAAAEMMRAGADPAYISREFFQNRTVPSLKLEKIVLDRMQLLCDGAFSFSYLTWDDFQACQAIKADADPLIDKLRDISGVRVALILRERDDGEVRGSLRSKDDTDVSAVARCFDGGGHKAAAGLTYHGPLSDALHDVPEKVIELCFAAQDK